MTNAAHHLLRALYLHALAPSTANQDAVRAAGAALDTETGRKLNGPRDAPNEAATLNAGPPAQILISAVGDDDAQWGWQVWDDVGELSAEGVVPSLAVALAQVAGVVNHTPRRFCDTVAARAAVDREFREEIEAVAAPDQVQIAPTGDDDGQLAWQVWDEVGDLIADGVAPSLVDALAQVAEVVGASRIQPSSGNVFRDLGRPDSDAKLEAAKETASRLPCHTDALPIAEAVSRKILDRAAFGLRKYGVSLDDAGHSPVALLTHLQEELMDGANYVEAFKRAMMAATAPIEPPHAAAPFLATLTPEPAEAVLGRAGEALAGSLPVYVLAGTGRHPYGDDAWHMETDGVARLFPSKEAAQRWLAAMGKPPA